MRQYIFNTICFLLTVHASTSFAGKRFAEVSSSEVKVSQTNSEALRDCVATEVNRVLKILDHRDLRAIGVRFDDPNQLKAKVARGSQYFFHARSKSSGEIYSGTIFVIHEVDWGVVRCRYVPSTLEAMHVEEDKVPATFLLKDSNDIEIEKIAQIDTRKNPFRTIMKTSEDKRQSKIDCVASAMQTLLQSSYLKKFNVIGARLDWIDQAIVGDYASTYFLHLENFDGDVLDAEVKGMLFDFDDAGNIECKLSKGHALRIRPTAQPTNQRTHLIRIYDSYY